MRAAAPAPGAFAKRVADRSADVFYVRIYKDMTVDERKHAPTDSRERLRTLEKKHPTLDRQALRLVVIRKRSPTWPSSDTWKYRWLTHPVPNMREPEKAICFDDYGDDNLAWLYNKASLRDFFLQVRRRRLVLERVVTDSNNRIWHG